MRTFVQTSLLNVDYMSVQTKTKIPVISDREKSFIRLTTGVNHIKTFIVTDPQEN
jgi:hypothetical protein